MWLAEAPWLKGAMRNVLCAVRWTPGALCDAYFTRVQVRAMLCDMQFADVTHAAGRRHLVHVFFLGTTVMMQLECVSRSRCSLRFARLAKARWEAARLVDRDVAKANVC